MTAHDDKSGGVPVSFPSYKRSGMFVRFFNKDGDERWLEETSIVGGMAGVQVRGDGTVCLTVREAVFRRRRAELQEFVCPP